MIREESQPKLRSIGGRGKVTAVLGVGGLVLAAAFILSVWFGSSRLPLSTLHSALFDYGPTREQLILVKLRLPRTVATMLIGANLAVAGALMQALTRNPLASPGIFGINAGASFVIVLSLMRFPGMTANWRMAAAFAGALGTALLVYVVSQLIRWGKGELRMALTGVTVQAFLAVATQALLLFNEGKTETVMFWLTGSAAGLRWSSTSALIPWSLGGLAAALLLSRAVSVLSLGEEVARGLGQRIGLLRAAVLAVVVVLAGISVSVCGPIGFVGLMVPHIARALAGVQYRTVIPVSAVLGAALLTLADAGSRLISFPAETPVGIVTAILGGPFFIYLARRRRISL